jgi:hypothetical protein
LRRILYEGERNVDLRLVIPPLRAHFRALVLLLVHKSLIGFIEFIPASLIFLLIVLLGFIIGVSMLILG